MSSSNQHISRIFDDVSLPYNVNVNIATRASTPYIVAGRNMLCLASSPMQRRPGFAPHVPSFGVGAVVKRIFTWHRWDGTYHTMYSVIIGTESYVYNGGVLVLTDTSSTEPFDFVVANNFLFMANGSLMMKWDGVIVTNWGIAAPTAAPTLVNAASGNVPSIIGHQYVFAYGVAATGYVSDISDLSNPTTVSARQWDVTGPRCPDAQCDQIHIYRTEDGGAVLYELSNSPIANPAAATWTLRDNDFDVTSVGSTPRQTNTQAPLARVNLPPVPFLGPKYFAGRIWGFNGDVLYNSGLEEVTNGVPEESFGNAQTNSQSFGNRIDGTEILGGADTGILLVYAGSTIFYISGNSLATFRIGTLARKRGCRNRATIVAGQAEVTTAVSPSSGGAPTTSTTTSDFVVWLDYSNTIRMLTSGAGIRDISFDIRDAIALIDHSKASITIHEDGPYRWLVLCDGGAGVLYAFDLDRGRWNTPWPLTGVTTVYSGEVASGVNKLIAGAGDIVLAMTYNVYEDNNVAFTSWAAINITSLLDPDKPEQVGVVEFIGLERDSHNLSDVSYLLDEDPTEGTPAWTSIFANETDPFLRATVNSPFQAEHKSGVNLVEKWYYLRDKSGARRCSMRFDWAANGLPFKLFTMGLITSRQGDS